MVSGGDVGGYHEIQKNHLDIAQSSRRRAPEGLNPLVYSDTE